MMGWGEGELATRIWVPGEHWLLRAQKPPVFAGGSRQSLCEILRRPLLRSILTTPPDEFRGRAVAEYTRARRAMSALQRQQALLAVAILVGVLAGAIAFAGMSAHSGGGIGLHLAVLHLAGFHFGIGSGGAWSDVAFTRRAGSRLRRLCLCRCDRRRSEQCGGHEGSDRKLGS